MDCTQDCIDRVGIGKYATVPPWHHRDCPNHTTACCVLPEDEDEFESDVKVVDSSPPPLMQFLFAITDPIVESLRDPVKRGKS